MTNGEANELLREIEKRLDERISAVEKSRIEVTGGIEKVHTAERLADLEAVKKAFAAATELSKSHNDLLRKMEKQGETFATKESVDRRIGMLEDFKSRITGGMIVLGAIGLSNLIKVWT